MNRHTSLACLVLLSLAPWSLAGPADSLPPAQAPATQAVARDTGEKIPSEDSIIKNLHGLGLLQGRTDVFRSACPVRDLVKDMSATQPSDAALAEAHARMKHLYDLGIRTIISFQKSGEDGPGKPDEQGNALILEKTAAEAAGLKFVPLPMANAGPHSLEDMSDEDVLKWVDAAATEILTDAKTGGVLFHCSAGHDRTGIVAAYIRIKYQHWPVEQAIEEMRREGHNWLKYSHNGGVSSWHEDHLRAIAKLLAQQ